MNPLDYSNIDRACSYQKLTGRKRKITGGYYSDFADECFLRGRLKRGVKFTYELLNLQKGFSILFDVGDTESVRRVIYRLKCEKDLSYETQKTKEGLLVRRVK